MVARIEDQNFYAQIGMPFGEALTIKGVEFEFEWYEQSVSSGGGKVYLRVTSPVDKYTIVNFREVRHNKTSGFYRQYLTFSGGSVSRVINPVKMRGDSVVNSGSVFEVLTNPIVNVNDAFSQIPLWGEAGPGSNPGQGSGFNKADSIRVIPPSSVVLLEFENTSSQQANWYAYFRQWEIFPSSLPLSGAV